MRRSHTIDEKKKQGRRQRVFPRPLGSRALLTPRGPQAAKYSILLQLWTGGAMCENR